MPDISSTVRILLSRPTPGSVRDALAELPAADAEASRLVAARESRLTKPPGSLGRLEELTAWLAAWQGRSPPGLDRVRAAVFAGNHGVAAAGVSAYPAEVTAQMVANFEHGGAAICALCRTSGVELRVRALDLGRPTGDIRREDALSEAEFADAFAVGMGEAADVDLLCLGEMGIGNTTAAAAIALSLFGGDAGGWTGPGTGVAGERLELKRAAVVAAATRHAADATDALDLLRRIGGREMVAIAGAVVAARLRRIPVLLDGFVCTAAVAPLAVVRPDALDHCRVSHVSAEPGHLLLTARLGTRPLFDLDLRLGEASGAVLAVGLARAALACHLGMATFAEAGVTERADERA